MIYRLAHPEDFDAIVALSAQVEYLFGPSVDNPEFHAAVRSNIEAGVGVVAVDDDRLAGGLLFNKIGSRRFEIGWLVVDEAYRAQGVGQELLIDAMARWVHPPADVEVVALGPDHPGAASVAFYERLGFEFVEPVRNGPEGGSRDRLRLVIEDALPAWATG